jgi:hypothetical protein
MQSCFCLTMIVCVQFKKLIDRFEDIVKSIGSPSDDGIGGSAWRVRSATNDEPGPAARNISSVDLARVGQLIPADRVESFRKFCDVDGRDRSYECGNDSQRRIDKGSVE